tara:strand:+ start:26807 stop:27484 length:678 start_codon:yes stop_codon:yes gene_type:complete
VFASSDDSSKKKPEASEVGKKGFVKGSGILSMDALLEVPIKRFKPTSEECPFCRDAPLKESGSKCLGICRNPQNVPGPLVYPHQMQNVDDAVRLQINALRENDEPRSHHGVQVMWEFSVESGNMERSRYFGISSDMYHYDHFIGKSLKYFDRLVRNKGVTKFADVSVMDDGRTMVKVEVADDVNKTTYWVFIMVKRSFGKYEGCWQSHRVIQTDEKYFSKYLEFI